MAKFIRINGALVQVASATSQAVLEQYEVPTVEGLSEVSVVVTKDFSDVDLEGGADETLAKFVFANTGDTKKVAGWAVTSFSATAYSTGEIVLYGSEAGVIAVHDFSDTSLASANTLTLAVEPAVTLASGERVSIYTSAAALTFTGSISVDVRRTQQA